MLHSSQNPFHLICVLVFAQHRYLNTLICSRLGSLTMREMPFLITQVAPVVQTGTDWEYLSLNETRIQIHSSPALPGPIN